MPGADSGSWTSFLRTARPSVDWQKVGRVLTLDPGETTGWSFWSFGELRECGEWITPSPLEMADVLRNQLHGSFNTVVYEEYRIRGNKFKEHVGSEVITIQNIGVIRVFADQWKARTFRQTAGMAKSFATDAKLRRWGLYQTGWRHANDAIRHGVYWHLFMSGR